MSMHNGTELKSFRTSPDPETWGRNSRFGEQRNVGYNLYQRDTATTNIHSIDDEALQPLRDSNANDNMDR